jgi:preprotein translocase subunit SecE
VATKGKTTKKSSSTVVRVTAKDTEPTVKAEKTKKEKAVKPAGVSKEPIAELRNKNPFKAMGGYFKGAWQELKQVRWPNRQATWGMTVALLGFTAFFVALILLLDALFKYVFQLILG